MTAEKIKKLREARTWTQAELARRLGVTRNFLIFSAVIHNAPLFVNYIVQK